MAANKNHSVDELSALFEDIDVENNLDTESSSDYGDIESDGSSRSFEEKCKDVQAVLNNEDEDEIKFAELEYKTSEPTVREEQVESPKPKKQKERKSSVSELLEPEIKESNTEEDDENPLQLDGQDLQAYKQIKKKYPQFVLFDGKASFKDFYRYKVRVLKNLLSSYSILNINDMNQEISSFDLNYSVGNDVASPELIQSKLDRCFSSRPRLAALLADAHNQLPSWKKASEMLSAKLWKDHESKGAHKRLSLDLEHMFDMHAYLHQLQGFIDAATIIDGVLKAGSDSLSRQLSCITIKQSTGAYEAAKQDIQEVKHQIDSSLDHLDTIEHGTVIERSKQKCLVAHDFGGTDLDSNDNFLDGIG